MLPFGSHGQRRKLSASGARRLSGPRSPPVAAGVAPVTAHGHHECHFAPGAKRGGEPISGGADLAQG